MDIQTVLSVLTMVVSAIITIGIPVLLHLSSRTMAIMDRLDAKIDRVYAETAILKVGLTRTETLIYGRPCLGKKGDCDEPRTPMV